MESIGRGSDAVAARRSRVWSGKADVMGLAEGVVLVDALKDKIKAELDRANVTLQDVQVRASNGPTFHRLLKGKELVC